jgi:transcriptional regulator of heat shock response
MVMNNREVQNRVVQLDRLLLLGGVAARRQLPERGLCRPHSLPDVRAQLLKQLQETRQHMNQLMQDAIQVAQKVFDTKAEGRSNMSSPARPT